MSNPQTREQFKDYCLRRLGHPVIEINVSDEQIEDRIDEALLYYHDYHFDGSERVLLRHQITQENIDNGYIQLDNDLIGISDIMVIDATSQTANMFNIRYQMHLNDLFDISSTSVVSYQMAMTHINMIQDLFNGKKAFRYNRHVNKLHIDMDWKNKVVVGEYIIIDCYRLTNPDTYSDVWADRWLARYTSALIKRQMGTNLSKFEGMQLPGNITFNGSKIYDEAQIEIDKLEEEMLISYSLPSVDFIG